jgi:membrane peptidoglycan carboxypeptidase
MEPTLIREIRNADGTVRWRHHPRIVRRVFPAAIAQQMREILKHTITEGTGKSAALTKFALAGKSGTTKLLRDGSYNSGDYTASFVGIFPADKPQLVILAKLDRPRGSAVYGGLVAAPIIKAIIEGTFAATRGTTLNRRELAAQAIQAPLSPDSGEVSADIAMPSPSSPASRVRVSRRARAEANDGAVPYLMAIAPERQKAAAGSPTVHAVPDVTGLSMREALLTLHEQGFRVVIDTLAGGGTAPAAGTPAMPGTLVRLHRTP